MAALHTTLLALIPKLSKWIPKQPQTGIIPVKVTIISKLVFVRTLKVLDIHKKNRQPMMEVIAVTRLKMAFCCAENPVSSPWMIVIIWPMVETASENMK